MATVRGCIQGALSDPWGLLDPRRLWRPLDEPPAPKCLGHRALLGLLPPKLLPLKIGASLEPLKQRGQYGPLARGILRQRQSQNHRIWDTRNLRSLGSQNLRIRTPGPSDLHL